MSYRYASDWIKNYNPDNWNNLAQDHIILLVDLVGVSAPFDKEIRKSCCNQVQDTNTSSNTVRISFVPGSLKSKAEKSFTLSHCSDADLQEITVVTSQKCDNAGLGSFCNQAGDVNPKNDCEEFINDSNLESDTELSKIKTLKEEAGGCLCKTSGDNCIDNDCAVCVNSSTAGYSCRKKPTGSNTTSCAGSCKNCNNGVCVKKTPGDSCDGHICRTCNNNGLCVPNTGKSCSCGSESGTCGGGRCVSTHGGVISRKTTAYCAQKTRERTDGITLKLSADECSCDTKCGSQTIDPTTHGCCNDNKFDLTLKVCCGSTLLESDPHSTLTCCNDSVVSKCSECQTLDSNCQCTNSKNGVSCTLAGGGSGVCSNGTCSSPESENQCSPDTVAKIGCCGNNNEEYNTETHACCDGNVEKKKTVADCGGAGSCTTPSSDECSCKNKTPDTLCGKANNTCGKCDDNGECIRETGMGPMIYKPGWSNRLFTPVCCSYRFPRVKYDHNTRTYECVECVSGGDNNNQWNHNYHCDAGYDSEDTDSAIEQVKPHLCHDYFATNEGGTYRCPTRELIKRGCCIENTCVFRGVEKALKNGGKKLCPTSLE